MSVDIRLLRSLFTAPVFLAFSVLLLTACEKDQEAQELRQIVAVYEVGSAAIQNSRQFHGRVVPADLTRVAFRVPGKISHMSVQAGQQVNAGQVLARIEDAIQRQVLADARAQFELSKRQLERAENLHKRGSLTPAQRDQLKAGFRLARAKLKLAEANMSYTLVKAPFDGTVDHVMKELYETVFAGETIATVSRIDRTDVLVDLPDGLPARVHETTDVYGIEVQARFSGSDEPYTMRMLKASAARNAKTQAFEYWLTMPSTGNPYPPGLTVTLTVDLQMAGFSTDAGFIVPLTALQAGSQRDSFQVWQVKDSVVMPVPVTVGQLTEQGALIQAGLQEGDVIVSGGLSRLTAGKVVIPQALEP